MELLRFFTAGNVDDGKSTLIGRLLFDSNALSTDIIQTLTRQSKAKSADTNIDLALITDGLRSEREQGITIDVAYKYFSTPKRKFIIADTPGHVQYTRNMFTGASLCDVAVILVDARNGITEQTKRHTMISSLLRIPHIVVCVNKMDMFDYDEKVFHNIVSHFLEFTKELQTGCVTFIPCSALYGDNVVHKSERMHWYDGPALLSFLENVSLNKNNEHQPARFHVQYVIRPQTKELHDYRGYAGQLSSGILRKGDPVIIYPNGYTSTIQKIEKHQTEVDNAFPFEPVVLHINDDLDVQRGNLISATEAPPEIGKEINAVICWLDQNPYQPGQKFILKQETFTCKAMLKEIHFKLDIHQPGNKLHTDQIQVNDICKVTLKLSENISYDKYEINKHTGSFILINDNTYNTSAAGLID